MSESAAFIDACQRLRNLKETMTDPAMNLALLESFSRNPQAIDPLLKLVEKYEQTLVCFERAMQQCRKAECDKLRLSLEGLRARLASLSDSIATPPSSRLGWASWARSKIVDATSTAGGYRLCMMPSKMPCQRNPCNRRRWASGRRCVGCLGGLSGKDASLSLRKGCALSHFFLGIIVSPERMHHCLSGKDASLSPFFLTEDPRFTIHDLRFTIYDLRRSEV